VPRDANAAPPANLWRDLRPHLPEFMMPSAIVWLPALPLNASGKIDRAALPESDASQALRPGTRVGPRDMLENLLVRIWEDLLGRHDIGVYDHLFEIGGHSLLAARLVDEIERATGTALSITALFLDDTVAGIARALRTGTPATDANVVAVHAGGKRPPFVFLHGDFTGGGFYSRALAHALGPDQPTIVVHPHGLDDGAIPPTVEAMAAERVAELRALWPHGPYVVGGHCNGAAIAFEMARQLAAQGEDVPAIVVVEAPAPLPEGANDEDVDAYRKRYRLASPEQAAVPHDRASDTRLKFQKVMEAYRGRPGDLHLAIIRAAKVEELTDDSAWARLAPSHERIVLPGGHMSMLTRHVGELSRTIRGIIDRATARPRATLAAGERAAPAAMPRR
jgi:thioesterase domain-containing protein